MLGRGSNRLDIDRRLLGAGRHRFRKPPAAFSDPCQVLGAAAHFLGAAPDARDYALHALLEAAGELGHHALAIRLGDAVLRRSFLLHAANSQRVFAEHLDSPRHAADLIAQLATRDRLVEFARGKRLHPVRHAADRAGEAGADQPCQHGAQSSAPAALRITVCCVC